MGKTLTAEAISERMFQYFVGSIKLINRVIDLRRPLYIVGAGDLGNNASELDNALTKLFAVVPVWNAVVLIDEADVFMEERASSDIQRNAMVSTFLRKLEQVHLLDMSRLNFAHIYARYFQGILFLTTNRVKTFDHAFQSRIHLSLHYGSLTSAAKEEIWRAFLRRIRHDVSADQIRQLSKKDMNGRQIKNAMKLAVVLSSREKEPLTFGHLLRTMKVIDSGLRATKVSAFPKPDIQLLGLLGVLLLCLILYQPPLLFQMRTYTV